MSVRDRAVVVAFGLPVTGKAMGKAETPGKTSVKTTGKTPAAILALLESDPGLSLPELAERLGKSPRAIERAVKKPRESGRLERIGPAKGGRWHVIE